MHDRLEKRTPVHDWLGGRSMLHDPAGGRVPAINWIERMADERVLDDQPLRRDPEKSQYE